MDQTGAAWLRHLRRIASAGGKARAAKLTQDQRSESSRKAGLVSGALRKINLNPAQRTEIASKAAQARWKKARKAARSAKPQAKPRKRG